MGTTSVEDLSSFFGVSTATIRRDIKVLEADNVVLRTVGGGILSRDSDVVNGDRAPQVPSIDEKIRIAEYCTELVEEHDEILVGPGTTAFLIGRILTGISDRRFRIITNSLELALEAARAPNIDAVILGGEVYDNHSAGFTAHDDYFSTCHRRHKTIISADGVDVAQGITLFDPRFLAVLRKMISVSSEVILAADSSKIGRVRYDKVADISAASLFVTDTKASEDFCTHLRQAGVPVVKV